MKHFAPFALQVYKDIVSFVDELNVASNKCEASQPTLYVSAVSYTAEAKGAAVPNVTWCTSNTAGARPVGHAGLIHGVG